jgi:hypothetical protein
MPTPKAGEKQSDYISRCIKKVMDDGTASDNKQAAAICYSMWKKHGEKADLTEFSLVVRSVGLNKKTGERYWKASTSDIFPDSYNDEMSMSLYRSFLDKIEGGEKPPAQYRSDTWDGGMPYVSVSHFREHSIAGDTDKCYVDGAVLKANGTFRDTPLGRACFEALCDDLYTKKSEEEDRIRVSIAFLDYQHQHKSNGYVFTRSATSEYCPECVKEAEANQRPGRIFMDGLLIHFAMTRVPVNGRTLMEVEKSMTTRKEDAASIVGESLAEELESKERSLVSKSDLIIKSEDIVPDTVEKMDMDESAIYVPFGGATSLADAKAWVDSSKEQQRVGDIWYTFQSVVGNIMRSDMEMEEKAKKVNECSEEFRKMVNDRNATIFESLAEMDIKSEVVAEAMGDEEEMPKDKKPMKKKKKKMMDGKEQMMSEGEDEEEDDDPLLARMDEMEESIKEILSKLTTPAPVIEQSTVTPHPLDSAFAQLRSDFDSVALMEGTGEDKLREIQPSFAGFGDAIRQLMASTPEQRPEIIEAPGNDALINLLQKMNDKMDLLTSQQTRSQTVAPSVVPNPRSISPARVQQIAQTPAQKPSGPTPHLRSIINRSVGLEE